MAERKPRLSEALMGVELVITCDQCGKTIDWLAGFWKQKFIDGELYNGTVMCPEGVGCRK